MAASDIANWWDRQKKESEKFLEEWVQDNPQWWAIGVATTTSTAMELGGGLVDVLRLGEGVAKGGGMGVFQDATRLLVVLGPLGKAGGLLSRFAHTRSLRLAVTTRGVTGPCTFTAVNNALSIASGRARNFFLTAKEAAKALGKPLSGLTKTAGKYRMAAWIDDLVPFLTKQGVRLKNLGQAKSLTDVVRAANTNNGVVIFAIEWMDLAGKLQRHSMIALRTTAGVRYADYGGKFISSLTELAKRGGVWATNGAYTVVTSGAKGSSILIEGMQFTAVLEKYGMQVFKGGLLLLEGIHSVQTASDGVDLAFPVAAAAAIDKVSNEPEVVKQSFEAYKSRRSGRPLVRLPAVHIKGKRKRPPRSDYLTGVQYRLNAAGFGAGPVDGIFGSKTKNATLAFQKAYKLTVDGIPGPKTQAKLVEVCGY